MEFWGIAMGLWFLALILLVYFCPCERCPRCSRVESAGDFKVLPGTDFVALIATGWRLGLRSKEPQLVVPVARAIDRKHQCLRDSRVCDLLN